MIYKSYKSYPHISRYCDIMISTRLYLQGARGRGFIDIKKRKQISILCLAFSRDLPIGWAMVYRDYLPSMVGSEGPPILAVYVKKRFRGTGVGTKLCNMAIARSDFTTYLVDNADGRHEFFDPLPMISEGMI